MKSTRLIIFENSTANFRLSVDTMLSKPRPDGSEASLVFIGKDKRTGTFRPSVFLVFTYLTDDFTTTQGVYTSFAHMYRIRSMFQTMHDILNSQDAYTTVNGELTSNSKYAQPLLLDKIGKNNDWISLTLSRYKDPTSTQYFPAVALQISKSNGYSSLLSAAEFEAIYDVIMHIDLVNMENQAALLEMITRAGLKEDDSANNQGASESSYHGNQPYGNGYHNNYGSHRFDGSGNYGSKQAWQQVPAAPHPQPNYQSAPVPQRQQPVTPAPTAAVENKVEDAHADPTITESPIPTNSPSKPKVSMEAVSQVTVDDVDMDVNDSSLIDGIFADANKTDKAESDSGNN